MNYICFNHYKGKSLTGKCDISYGEPLELHKNMLFYDGKPVCVATSFVSHKYFANNEDGKGLERGKLTHNIIKKLGGTHLQGDPTPEWDAIWDDEIANKYRREQEDWLWSHEFYQAPIEDLQHMWTLVEEAHRNV